MNEERCWFCGRDKQALIDDLPPGFWDDQQDMFFKVEVIGKVCAVDKVRPTDPPHSRHFHRQGGPDDEASSFDDRRFAIISRKCMTVPVCRVCRSVEIGLASISEDSKGLMPHRPIYAPSTEELTIARGWERMRGEEKRMEAEYPDEAYRALQAIMRLNNGAPITLWDLSQEMNVFNHRSLEKPVIHILNQCPELGELDRKTLTLHIRDPREAQSLLRELATRYERFYDRDVRQPAPQTVSHNNEVLARIKKLNNPTDTLQYYAKW